MKVAIFSVLLILLGSPQAGDIIGKWQLVKESYCAEDELAPADEAERELIEEMQSMSSAAPRVINFRENRTAQESTRIINRRKAYNSNTLLYKITPTTLYFLDKRSQTIIETFSIEKLTADSLILTNSERACDTRVFIKIHRGRE